MYGSDEIKQTNMVHDDETKENENDKRSHIFFWIKD